MTVILRPYTEADLPRRLMSESEYDDFGPSRVMTAVPTAALNDDWGHLAIVVDDEVVGDIGWHWTSYGPPSTSRCVNVGLNITDPARRGRGLGTEAQRQLADLMFRHTTTNRVEAGTDVTNVAEQRALEKAGFTREGVVRGAQWRRGEFHDMVTYSVLRREWT